MNRLAEHFVKAEMPGRVAMDCTRKSRSLKPSSAQHLRLLTIVLFAVAAPSPAFAYIDPNAGGMLYQALFPMLAALVGAWSLLRNWFAAQWARLRRMKRPDDSSGVDQ